MMGEMQGRMQEQFSISQNKIAYMMREKQDADDRIAHYEDTITKYARMIGKQILTAKKLTLLNIEHLQEEGKIDKDKLSNNNMTFQQQKHIEDELRGSYVLFYLLQNF